MTVEHRLYVVMAERGIKSLAALAKMANVNYRSLFHFASNKAKTMDPDLIGTLCVTLDCHINELLVLKKK
jgi:DNA-binding Xre family transcriptional regulator